MEWCDSRPRMSPALLLSPVNIWPDGKKGPKLTFEETILIIGSSRPRRVAAFRAADPAAFSFAGHVFKRSTLRQIAARYRRLTVETAPAPRLP
jgi:hypothetical protein